MLVAWPVPVGPAQHRGLSTGPTCRPEAVLLRIGAMPFLCGLSQSHELRS